MKELSKKNQKIDALAEKYSEEEKKAVRRNQNAPQNALKLWVLSFDFVAGLFDKWFFTKKLFSLPKLSEESRAVVKEIQALRKQEREVWVFHLP